jgi:hypothetical protein
MTSLRKFNVRFKTARSRPRMPEGEQQEVFLFFRPMALVSVQLTDDAQHLAHDLHIVRRKEHRPHGGIGRLEADLTAL